MTKEEALKALDILDDAIPRLRLEQYNAEDILTALINSHFEMVEKVKVEKDNIRVLFTLPEGTTCEVEGTKELVEKFIDKYKFKATEDLT